VDILEYRYRPKPWVMLAAGLFFAGIGAFLVMEALGNQRGLVIQRIIHLSPQGATALYWCLAVACLLFAVGGLAGFVSGLTSERFLRLTRTEVSAPRFAWSRADTVVPLADITEVGTQTIQRQRFLHIHHRGGKLSICQSFLPDAAAFEELHRALVTRWRAAG
jgi:hypothetical protein